MNAKKFLKIVKSLCCDRNCDSGKCPMLDKKEGCLMMGCDNIPECWNIKKILKAVKKADKAKHKTWVIRV